MDKKILVIEDDPIALRLIEYTLNKKGYQVLRAKDGLDGLSKARSEEPDLIILDIMLPGMDGFEICHRLRAKPQTAHLPIIILSGKTQPVDKAIGLKVGADDYLTKPIAPKELLNQVEAMLTRKTAARSKIIGFLGAKEGVGTTTMVVNVAITLLQKNKGVIVADLCSSNGNITKRLGLKPDHDITELLAKPIDTIDHRDMEAALTVHPTGIRVLSLSQRPNTHKKLSSSDVNSLLERLREVTDYLLIDLPSPPSDIGKAILTKCDLIIIVTDFKAGALLDLKSASALLHKLGITQERLGAVVIDRESTFPEAGLANMKSIIELNTQVNVLGVIPYETKASLKPVPDTTPVILSKPNCPMSWSIREVARHIG